MRFCSKTNFFEKICSKKKSDLTNAGNPNDYEYLFCHFFRQVELFFKNKIRKNSNSADPSCGYAGGSPPGRGQENARQDPGYPLCGFVSKQNCSTMTPPWTLHVFQNFLSVLDHRSPLLYIFLLLREILLPRYRRLIVVVVKLPLYPRLLKKK